MGVFRALTGDTSRWVRMAMYESLGPLIATFADEGRVRGFAASGRA